MGSGGKKGRGSKLGPQHRGGNRPMPQGNEPAEAAGTAKGMPANDGSEPQEAPLVGTPFTEAPVDPMPLMEGTTGEPSEAGGTTPMLGNAGDGPTEHAPTAEKGITTNDPPIEIGNQDTPQNPGGPITVEQEPPTEGGAPPIGPIPPQNESGKEERAQVLDTAKEAIPGSPEAMQAGMALYGVGAAPAAPITVENQVANAHNPQPNVGE